MSCDVCRGTNSSECPVCGRERWERVTCPKCEGIGLERCWAMSMRTGDEIEVSVGTYLALAEDMLEAKAKGEHYYRCDADECELCGGRGEVMTDGYQYYEIC